jgi:hypothetical protein
MKKSLGLIATLMFLGGSSSVVWAASLVADGSFESPIVPVGSYVDYSVGQTFGGSGSSDWSVVGPGGAVSVISGAFMQASQFGAGPLLNFVAQDGQQWMDLAGSNSNLPNGVQQTIATTNGQTYQLSFWVGNVYDPAGYFGVSTTINLFLNGLPFMTAINTSSTNPNQYWQNFTGTFVATGPTTLKFINGDPITDYVAGLDNIDVSPIAAVPLPATLPLFASGLGGFGLMGWWRRRKQAQVTS